MASPRQDRELHEAPPASLVDLLAGLELADAALLLRLERRVRRLARGLPLFDSVWIDALVQAGDITPFQAAEIHAGRGRELAIGPFVVVQRLRTLGPITTYRAFERVTRRPVRLTVADVTPVVQGLDERLRDLLARSKRLQSAHLVPVDFAQIVDQRAVIACAWTPGHTTEEWLIRQGRFTPATVLQIARQMLIALRDLETAGLHHGDLTPREIIISDNGQVALPAPGLRSALRPVEGFAFADLSPDGFAAIPPERIALGRAVNRASDVFGCGLLWWHLLMGRSPWPLANSVATQRAILKHRVPSLTTIVPDLPTALATAIDDCTEPDPDQRPTLEELEARIKPATDSRGRVEMPANVAATTARLSGFRTSPGSGPRRAQLAIAMALFACLALFAWRYLDRHEQGQARVADPKSSPADLHFRPALTSGAGKVPSDPAVNSTAIVDPSVTPATHVARSLVATPAGADDLVLPHDRPLHLNAISPRAKQVVRGQPGARPQVWISRPGLSISAEDVRFDGVDFVWNDRAGPVSSNTRPDSDDVPAMFTLLARGARFDRCSFQMAPGCQSSAEVLRAVESRDRPDSLPTTTARFTDCVMQDARGVVNFQRPGSLTAEFSNTLFVRCSSVVSFARRLQADEPMLISFDRCTLRDGDCLVAWTTESPPSAGSPIDGQVSVHALNCAFAPHQNGALLKLPLRELAENVEWAGQGTVIPAATRVLHSTVDDSRTHDAADDNADQLRASGLVRGQFHFAGDSNEIPVGCQITRWTAPLQSIEPPGADCTRLTMPRLEVRPHTAHRLR